MSHQTGIQADDNLKKLITKCKSNDSNIRVIKISIIDEKLVASEQLKVASNYRDDWTKFLPNLVQLKQPCYLLFRLDSLNGLKQYEWVLISWTPDDSIVRQKMLYASTKATLKMTFGGGSIVFDYFATTKGEMTFESFILAYDESKKFEDHKEKFNSSFSKLAMDGSSNDHLLTEKEQSLIAVKREEALTSAHLLSTKSSRTLPGLQFPLTMAANVALVDFQSGKLDYVQFSINTEKEEIDTTDHERSFSIDHLPNKIPTNTPRYHLFRFKHQHENQQYNSVIFVYSVPSGHCPVKERMLYSSCKNSLVNAIQDKQGFSINIDRKLESDSPNELTRGQLLNELHPIEDTGKPKFAKPKGPSGARGARRLIKVNENE